MQTIFFNGLCHVTDILLSSDQALMTGIVFLDFPKASDMVNQVQQR